MHIKSKFLGITLIIVLLSIANFYLQAQTLRVAVAANAQNLIKKLQVDFKNKTGITFEVVVGASGKLTTQIMHGAPYDVFLSADSNFPLQLFNAGFGLEKPVIYAKGSLIICAKRGTNLVNWQQAILNPAIKKIALANPKTAPYGKAAAEALGFYNLNEKITAKIVFGESISQVNTYLTTGNAQVAFTTEAFLYERLDKNKIVWKRVDSKTYSEIKQSAILLKHAGKSKDNAARKFYTYLLSSSAQKIIGKSGYHPINN